MLHQSLLASFFVSGILFSTLSACSDTDQVVDPPPDAFTVGVAGGTLSFGDGVVVLVIPAGALSQDVTFTFVATTSFPSAQTVITASVYELGPTGTTFAQPATLTVRYVDTGLPTGVRELELGLYKVVSDTWQLNQTSEIDDAANTLSASIDGLSVFGILGAPVASVSVIPPTATILVDATQQLTAILEDAAAVLLPDRTVTWSSSNEPVATVDDGLVAGVAAGETTVSATSEGVSGTATITVTAPGSGLINSACSAYPAPIVPAPLRTFHVDGDAGNDSGDGLSVGTAWRTLGKANATAQPGDLFLLRGTFRNENIRPSPSGTALNKIVYAAAPGQSAVIDGGKFGVIAWLDDRSHIVIDGIEMTNAAQLMQLTDANNNWIRNVYLHDGGGIRLQRASDNRFEDSRIDRIGSEAANAGDGLIILGGANRNIIVRNTMTLAGHNSLTVGIYQNAADPTADDNIVAHNTFSNSWAGVVDLAGKANRTILECNRIADAADGTGPNFARAGLFLRGTNNIARYNEIFNNGADGISMQSFIFDGFTQPNSGNHVHNNTVSGNGSASIQILQKEDGLVTDNIIENNIFWDDAGFTFESTTYAMTADLYNSDNIWPDGTVAGNIIRHNIFPTGQSLMLLIRQDPDGGNVPYTLTQAEATLAGWENNLQVDPFFIDAIGLDFSLQAGSPAIDWGRIIGSLSFLGAAPDLGARERQ